MTHLVFCSCQEPGNLKKIYSHFIGEFEVLAHSVNGTEKLLQFYRFLMSGNVMSMQFTPQRGLNFVLLSDPLEDNSICRILGRNSNHSDSNSSQTSLITDMRSCTAGMHHINLQKNRLNPGFV